MHTNLRNEAAPKFPYAKSVKSADKQNYEKNPSPGRKGQDERDGQDAGTENYQTKPSLGTRFKVHSHPKTRNVPNMCRIGSLSFAFPRGTLGTVVAGRRCRFLPNEPMRRPAQFKVSSSKLKVIENYETNPTHPVSQISGSQISNCLGEARGHRRCSTAKRSQLARNLHLRNDGMTWKGAGKKVGSSTDCLPPGSMKVIRSNQRIFFATPIA